MFKKHPYILVTTIATLLAIIVWMASPKEYFAITKLSDEYTETDLAIGLDRLSAQLNNLNGGKDEGINDILIYHKFLDSDDFIRHLARIKIGRNGATYGEYLGKKDTIATVRKHLLYNVSNLNQTITIQFSDHDPAIAFQMLDSVTSQLQKTITFHRNKNDEKRLQSALQRQRSASLAYHRAKRDYAFFSDTHFDSQLKADITKSSKLEKDVELAFKEYQKATIQCVRLKALTHKASPSFAVIKNNSMPQKANSHPLPYIFSFVLMALVATKGVFLLSSRRKEKSGIEWGGLFSPWTITIFVWLGLALLFQAKGEMLYPLTSQFYLSISLWIPIFIITSFLTFNLMKHQSVSLKDVHIDINKGVFLFFFIISIIICPLYIHKVWQIVSMFDPDEMMSNVRILAVYGEGMGILNYTIVISQSLLLVALWRYPQIKGWQLAVIIICCMINSIAVMEKGGFFLVGLCSLYVLYERGKIKIHAIFSIGCIFLLLFYSFNLLRAGADSTYAKEETLLDFIGMYVMSPPVAYCTVMQETGTQFGTNTFEVLYLLLNRWGIGNYEVHSKVQEFVFVPISTNVYTIMQPFFRDFGYLGIAFFAWLYGLAAGILYRLSCNGNAICICLYTYMVEVLVLQFYQENIFLSMVFVLQIVFFVFLFTQRFIRLSIIPSPSHARK